MNKKVSKALAAVLSAAMAASAFAMSTSASFAAGSNNVEVVTTPSSVAITTASTGSSAYTLDGDSTVSLVANDQTVSDVTIEPTGPWKTSNAAVASVDANGKVVVTETGASTVKTVTFTRNVKVTSNKEVEYNSHDKTQTVSANGVERVDVTIYPQGYKLVAVDVDDPTTMKGKPATTAATVSVNEEAKFSVYEVSRGSSTGKAQYTKLTDVNDYEELGNDFSVASDDYTADTLTVEAQDPDDVNVGATASIRVKDAEDIQPATLTVENTYEADNNDTFAPGTAYGQAGKTYSDDDYDVTNMDIVGVDSGETINVNAGASVGDISGDDGTVKVDGATTGNIDVDAGTVNVTATTAAATTGNVTAGTVEVNDDTDAVYAISMGDIKGDATVTGVTTADAEGAYAAIETGDITGEDVDVTASQNVYKAPEGAVTVGNIVATGTITLEAGEDVNSMTLGTISGKEGHYADCPYTAKLVVNSGTFNLGDLTYIGEVTIGNSGKKATVTAGKVDTGTYSAGTTACSLVSNSKVTVNTNARLNASSIKTAEIAQAPGTIQIPAGQLTVTEESNNQAQQTGVKLIVPGMTTNSTLYTTSSQLPNLFQVVGADSLKAEVSGNAWIYKPQNIVFAGIEMTQDEIEVGTSPVTLSIKTIPDSTTLPEGVTVKWEADKDTVELTPSADGMSCTVTATGYTANNANGSNNVVVKATLMNENGTAYSANNVFFTTAETSVTLTGEATVPANPFAVVVTNGEGQQITCDPNGSTVIEVPQSMAFNFDISSEETQPFDYTVGNGSIGGTNTNTVWNGTSGQYQIYAAGAVGSETGAYVNGIKIFTLKVTDRPFESDTTLNMDLKVGQKYQFEITLDDPAAPFTFLTADGAALSTSYNPDTYPAENGKYYCSVTAQQAGRDIGVYCVIDGKTYKIFTAHTVA